MLSRFTVFAAVNSSLGSLILSLLVLGLAGTTLNAWTRPIREQRGLGDSVRPGESWATATGRGLSVALLGGYRRLAADFAWIKLYAAWERRDLVATPVLLNLVTAIEPRSEYFWRNGARILAYDVPAWRIAAAGGAAAVPPRLQAQIRREQAELALRFLDSAGSGHSHNSDWWSERAAIELWGLGDVEAAAASYRRAWECSRSAYLAGRLHAELLRQLGRREAARAWLVRLHPELPADDAAAGAGLVLTRIRQWETELGTSPEQIYRPRR